MLSRIINSMDTAAKNKCPIKSVRIPLERQILWCTNRFRMLSEAQGWLFFQPSAPNLEGPLFVKDCHIKIIIAINEEASYSKRIGCHAQL